MAMTAGNAAQLVAMGRAKCSFPRAPRLSPDGQQILFFNEVDEWNEEKQGNVFHVYLSMIPVTGGPIVRLEEVGSGHAAGVEWRRSLDLLLLE